MTHPRATDRPRRSSSRALRASPAEVAAGLAKTKLSALTAVALLAPGTLAQSWALLPASTLPHPVGLISNANTPIGETVVLHDQLTGVTYVDQAFDWAPLAAQTNSPPIRDLSRMVGDASQAVLFGGRDINTSLLLNDTWRLFLNQFQSSGTWVQVSSTNNPSPRILHAMMSRPVGQTGEVFLFGGFDNTAVLGDLWRLNSAGWTQLQPTGPAPSPRAGALLCEGPDSTLILFGCQGTCSDTWMFTPATNSWQQILTPVSPPPRFDGGMAFDASRGVVVLAGGIQALDTWELSRISGTFSWRQVPAVGLTPGPVTLVRNPATSSVRAATNANGSAGPWEEFQYNPSPVNVATFPATPWTCAVSGSPLLLQPTSLPVLGTTFTMNVLNAAPGAALLGLFELRGPRTPIPLGGGCFGFLVGGAGTGVDLISNLGSSSPWSIPIAASPAGVGLQIDFQVLHVEANPTVFKTTQLVAATLGF